MVVNVVVGFVTGSSVGVFRAARNVRRRKTTLANPREPDC